MSISDLEILYVLYIGRLTFANINSRNQIVYFLIQVLDTIICWTTYDQCLLTLMVLSYEALNIRIPLGVCM